MKVQKIKLNSYDVTWIILNDNYLPIRVKLQNRGKSELQYLN
ncbi:hypothetical protein LLB_2101 [Legionella longbeachae D-4968]|nr:hypothetical protein LLB_2101 [Legionella longbeachae D-4968]